MEVKPISVDFLIENDVHHVRYGDACWLLMTGRTARKRRRLPKTNHSGHALDIPGMGESIRETLDNPAPRTIFGVTPNSIKGWPKEVQSFDIDWYHGDLWKDLYLSESDDANKFIYWLNKRDVCLVGPAHLKALSVFKPVHYVETFVDSWRYRNDIIQDLKEIEDEIDVVLFSASFATQIAMWSLAHQGYGPRMIDTGAFWDQYVGVWSRAFHKAGRKIKLKRRR